MVVNIAARKNVGGKAEPKTLKKIEIKMKARSYENRRQEMNGKEKGR